VGAIQTHPLGDALVLENEMAQAVASRGLVTVNGVEHARLKAALRVSPEVQNYLQGNSTRSYN